MIRICFVCHGNICRSPMAEFIMKDLVKKAGRENDFYIVSRATHTDEIFGGIGSHIYPPAQKELRKHGIPFDNEKRATRLKKSDAEEYDLFIGMDDENMMFIPMIIGYEAMADNKIRKLPEYCKSTEDVSDPWYTNNFSLAYRDISEGCTALLEAL